jgi:hypothetical protein
MNLPARPDAPLPVTKKTLSKGQIIGLVIVGLIGLSALSSAIDKTPTVEATAPIDAPAGIAPAEVDISAATVVDVMDDATVQQFCGYYAQLSYSQALAAFTDGYGAATTNPDAGEVFAELASRC